LEKLDNVINREMFRELLNGAFRKSTKLQAGARHI